MQTVTRLEGNKAAAAVGLKTAVRILDKWQASNEQGEAILRVSHSTYARARRGDLTEIKLDSDQLTRVSYLLNIHAALRMLFENPENVYGFVSMANHNPYFNGRTPLDVIGGGDFAALYETFKRLDSLRGAQW
ncbi:MULTISPECIES: antitoxin Xre-like helix-turn-helix domain-containing protein [unclassified Halomonas]|uniref:antitoxin Xre-like helix-turn-helix domain-containing protein n=1 Tax=unclassified Halomonas TaxID=2609666 RepID=UPI00207690FF|nr:MULTISPECIES: antitoxin Xre-like helix-turn-helix domain-containing protein [unclassified Halomonas]